MTTHPAGIIALIVRLKVMANQLSQETLKIEIDEPPKEKDKTLIKWDPKETVFTDNNPFPWWSVDDKGGLHCG